MYTFIPLKQNGNRRMYKLHLQIHIWNEVMHKSYSYDKELWKLDLKEKYIFVLYTCAFHRIKHLQMCRNFVVKCRNICLYQVKYPKFHCTRTSQSYFTTNIHYFMVDFISKLCQIMLDRIFKISICIIMSGEYLP